MKDSHANYYLAALSVRKTAFGQSILSVWLLMFFACSAFAGSDEPDRFNARNSYDATIEFIKQAEKLGLAKEVAFAPARVDCPKNCEKDLNEVEAPTPSDPGIFTLEYADGTAYFRTSGISNAITEGRFNPYFGDLIRAWHGIRLPTNITNSEGLSAQRYRNKVWNRAFGGLSDKQAFLLLQYNGIIPQDYFITFENSRGVYVSQIETTKSQESIVTYFVIISPKDKRFAFRDQYDELRKNLYLPMLRGETRQITTTETPNPQKHYSAQESEDKRIAGYKRQQNGSAQNSVPQDSQIHTASESEAQTNKLSKQASGQIVSIESPSESVSSINLSRNSVSSGPVEAFVIFFANSGMLLEFGDEIFCAVNSLAEKSESEGVFSSQSFKQCRSTARQKIAYVEENYALIGIIGAILGYVLLAPLKVFFAKELSAQKEWRGVFKTVFKVEMVEAGVCVAGQFMTDGNLPIAMLSLVIGFGSGVVRGGALAAMHSWKYNPNFRFQVGLWVFAVIAGLVYFFNITEF